MNEGEYVWDQCVEAADPQGNVRELNDQELGKLKAHVSHIIKRNGAGGVPSLVLGLVELEAAERFFKQR